MCSVEVMQKQHCRFLGIKSTIKTFDPFRRNDIYLLEYKNGALSIPDDFYSRAGNFRTKHISPEYISVSEFRLTAKALFPTCFCFVVIDIAKLITTLIIFAPFAVSKCIEIY